MQRHLIFIGIALLLIGCGAASDSASLAVQEERPEPAVTQEAHEEDIAEPAATQEAHSENYKKIAGAYAECSKAKEIEELNFSPCEALDDILLKQGVIGVENVTFLKFEMCKIINSDSKDIIVQASVEDELRSYTYFMPFLYSGEQFRLAENAVVVYTYMAGYQLVDIDGDDNNEIIVEYLQTHNGTDRIIQMFHCDWNEGSQEVYYKSFNEFTHEIKYGFSDDTPKEFWVEDAKTYYNTEKEKKVAERVKTIYHLRDGKYKKKSKEILEKSDLIDFYNWTLA